MSTGTDVIGYRSDAVPDRTRSEQLRHSFRMNALGWTAVCAVVFLFWLFFGLGVLQLRGEPADGGHLLGSAIAALLFASPAIVFGGYKTLSLESAYTPHVEIEEKWRRVLNRCGVTAKSNGTPLDGVRVRYLSGNSGLNEVALKLPDGVAPEKLGRASSSLANAWGVPGVRIWRHPGGWFSLQLLGELPPAPPEPTPEPEPYVLPVARTWAEYAEALPIGVLHRHTAPGYHGPGEFGYGLGGDDPARQLPRAWGLPLLGTHVLMAGRTGAGKSSWIQAIIAALRPMMAHRAAILVGIDPKGVELALGRGFFKYYASEYDSIADLLELMLAKMNERKETMRGKSRLMRPSAAAPLYVIIVDEMAAIGKLDIDAKRRARTIAALNLLITQGRALGFSVVGAVQDPTKDTIPLRDYFTIRVALALTAPMVDLVLGAKCRDEGANAHLITKEWAGAGYLHDGEGWAFVRADWVSDDEILRQAAEFVDGEYQGDLSAMFLPIDEGTPHRRSRAAALVRLGRLGRSQSAPTLRRLPTTPRRGMRGEPVAPRPERDPLDAWRRHLRDFDPPTMPHVVDGQVLYARQHGPTWRVDDDRVA